MSLLLPPEVLLASETAALERLRRRYARQVCYPWLSDRELLRLEFWRYYRALHGCPAPPSLSEEAQALGRTIELYLTGYGRRRACR